MTTTAAPGIRTNRDSCAPCAPRAPTLDFTGSAGAQGAQATRIGAQATAAELLAECHARHIDLQANGGQLDIDAPAGVLTDELLQALRIQKTELLELLASSSHTPPDLQPEHGDGQPLGDDDPGDWTEYTTADGRRGWVRADVAGLEYHDWPGPIAQRLMAEAQQLRARYPVPDADLHPRPMAAPRTWPAPVPDAIKADPIPTCSNCGRLRVVPGQPGTILGLCFSCWSKRR